MYHELTITQETAHGHSLGTTWFIDSHGATFTNSLLLKTNEIVKKNGSTLNPSEVFSSFSTPPKNSLGIEEEIESLGIVARIQKDKKAKAIFMSLRAYDAVPSGILKPLVGAMKKHYEKWCWTPFGYRGPAYG